ncbi:MAG: glycosyl hydrolase family 28 protein [Clostridia bacterium]|nr:glycosyl hydrolase family 28 protein [Clostridia bacterium]
MTKPLFYTPNDPECRRNTDAESIQSAVDTAVREGVFRVVIPPRNERTGKNKWVIGETVLLSSGVTVFFDGCFLEMEDGVFANMFRNRSAYTARGKTREGADRDIFLIGRGNAVLSGGNPNGLTESTSEKSGFPHIRNNNLILFANVENFSVECLTFIHPRWWTMNFYYCRQGRISHIRFFARQNVPNQDGIDLRCGCHDILVNDITGQTGDDMVALTALPHLSERLFAVEGEEADIHDVTVKDVRGFTAKAVVALRNQDGAKLYRVTVENITDTSSEASPFRPYCVVRIGQNAYVKERSSLPGETYGITVKGVTATCGSAVVLGSTLTSASLRDIFVTRNAVSAVSVPEGAVLDGVFADGVFVSSDASVPATAISRDGDVFREDCGPYFAVFHFNNYGHPLLAGRDETKNFVVRNVYVSDLCHRPLVSAIGNADVRFSFVFGDFSPERDVIKSGNAQVTFG